MNKAIRNVAQIKSGRKNKISVILLAAGEANRMKSYGPRSLIKVTPEMNLVTHQINTIKESMRDTEIILVCGHEADKVMNNTPNDIVKIHNEFYDTTNISRSMALGLRAATTDRILFVYGDLMFNQETLANADFEESSVWIDKFGLFEKDEVGCTLNENDSIEYMLYDLPNKWAQILYLANKELTLFRNIVWNREKDKLFGFEIINEIIDKNGTFIKESPKNMKIKDIDSSKDLQHISTILS